MSKKEQQQEFDLNKPYRTRLGHEVLLQVFESNNKILGIITLDDGDGLMCEWTLKGLKRNLFPRQPGEKHDLDLVNVNGH